LDESKKQLEKAYDELEKITALTERQRIAKEIHDTAGHSITTVIMQTEAAKLVIDTDKDAAKKNIIAANLQAKHALEELRESVHLLSGVSEREPLKSALQRIIGETVDGTGIRIRSEIEDVALSDEKYRFVCNTFKEGLSNGIRHGKATAFWFEVKKDGESLKFLLSDNGDGMPVDTLNKGFGLSGMEREAARLGGKVWFESETGEGFEVHLQLPLN
jgi:signal transduction histidine kinase